MSADARREEPGDRRHGERRRADRRSPEVRTRPVEESWFGALGVAIDTSTPDDTRQDDAQSRFDSWASAGAATQDTGFFTRQAQRLVGSGANAFQRIYRAFIAARATLGLALVATQLIGALLGVRSVPSAAIVCTVYAAQALTLWLLPRFRTPPSAGALARVLSLHWLATIGVDLLTFSLLLVLEPASHFNYVALLVLPVLMAGVLTPRLIALATASAVAVMLLVMAWRQGLADGDLARLMSQAGLAGIGFFLITLLTSELAGRLAREELTARGSLELARQQAQLNRLVIEQMQDGVMVVDRRGRVRIANPAARQLLMAEGLAAPAPFHLEGHAAWEPVLQAVRRAFDEGYWPEGGREIALAFGEGEQRTLVMRVRFTRRRADMAGLPPGEALCVLFLEDLRSAQARTRQEQLAAMGRVSAGIAHEIRNPLATITQANALLAEDLLNPEQQRLTRMVADNAERLKRIVDDVLDVAPGVTHAPQVIDATAEVALLCSEWARTVGLPLGGASRLHIELPPHPVGVLFDPDHLRRVLINLLDNARRHASDAPGAILLELVDDGEASVSLSVKSDGPPIPPEVERHLFEPFFSTRSRGTGLGLYICKELCERYGAAIEYRPRCGSDPRRNEFHVTMRPGVLALPESTLLP
ncbi:MAG TPA: ATP-binding protein [Burkholderiaceae bacterium]|nr:ATP-binding protein [Burkholderiaceae bacterium]